MKSGVNDCYEAAGRLVSTLPARAFLVHGFVFSTKLNRMIRHAWVELDDVVYDFSNGARYKLSKKDYYREGKVEAINIYSRQQAILMLEKTRRFEWWNNDE